MLSNTIVQIIIGFAPFFLLFTGMSILSPKHRARNICLAVLVAAVAGTGAFIFRDGEDAAEGVPEADGLRFAYALMDEGCYDLAAEVIQQSRATGSYSEESTLALARVTVLQDKPQAALALYRKLEGAKEQGAALALSADDAEGLQALRQQVLSEVDGYLSDNKSKRYDAAAQAAAYAEEQYARFISGGDVDRKEIEKRCKDVIRLCESEPELLRIAPLRVARMKLQLMLEDYAGIAECVDDYADYNELLVVSELYMNGYITAKDFSEEYREGDMDNYKVVSETLQDVYDEHFGDSSRAERRQAQAQMDALEALMQNPSLIKVQNSLLDYTEGEFAYDRSRVYLQLAKTESYMENPVKSTEYVDRSFNTVGDCADEEYTAPMYEIISIIADKDDPERLKDVADHTERVLTNVLTVQMEQELRAPKPVTDKPTGTPDSGSDKAQEAAPPDFAAQLNTYVSQKRMAINISGVEANDDRINANINISGDLDYSLNEIKELLEVSDCELDISSYSLEKLEYDTSNILLCCDVSGSMSDAIGNLRTALKEFVNTTDEIEKVALVTFSDRVEEVCLFEASNEERLAMIDRIWDNGGTNIHDAVRESISYFEQDLDAVNTIILMSDGDAGMPDDETFEKEIVRACKEKGITIYSIGLTGYVNSNLLTRYASATGGSYVYAEDSTQIAAFFEGLRAQTLNGYRLTFRAQDTLQNTRNLRVSLSGESYTYDEEWYTLDGSPVDESATGGNVIFFDNKAVYGFDEKLIYKSGRSRDLILHGSGFEREDKFSLSLQGSIDYNDVAWTYVSDTMLKVTVPAGIACDSYDVCVALNGRKTTLNNGLTVVVQGSEKKTVFGDYVFTSYFKETTDDGVVLSQYVTMNGWLNFRGDVKLVGDLGSDSITLITSEGAYVCFDSEAATGAAAAYAGRDVALPLNDEFTLYRRADSDRRETRIQQFKLPDIAVLGDAYTAILPDKLTLRADEITLIMPYLDDVLSAEGLYTYRTEVTGSISAADITLSAQHDSLDHNSRPRADDAADLGNIPIYINDGSTEFSLSSEGVTLGYAAALPFISRESAFDLYIFGSWGEGKVRLDDVQLRSAYDVALEGVPADVRIGAMSLSLKQNTDKYVLVGGFSLDSATLAELFPNIESYLGDMAQESLVSCTKSEIVLPLGEYCFTAKADVTMMKHIKLDGILMELGSYDYTNKLLGMDDGDAYGFRGITDAAVAVHNDGCDIDLDGDIGASITDSFIGISCDGTVKMDADWWSATQALDGQGSAVMGVQKTRSGELVFVTRATSGDNTFYIQWSAKGGANYGSTQI